MEARADGILCAELQDKINPNSARGAEIGMRARTRAHAHPLLTMMPLAIITGY
jgi:hypothetical protein